MALDDDILGMLKQRALDEGRAVQEVTNDLLRQVLQRPPTKDYRLHLVGWAASLRPGVDITNRDTLFDIMSDR